MRATEEINLTELLELSRLYHTIVSDIADAWGVAPTASQRARAFQIISDLGDNLKMRALAAAVVAEVKNANA